MGVGNSAFSSGNIMRELRELRRRVRQLESVNRLESASIGAGGLRIHSGGRIVVQDDAGDDTLVAEADAVTLQGVLRVLGGGDIQVTGGRLVASDDDGDVFAVDPTVPSIDMRKALIASLAVEIVGDRIHAHTSTSQSHHTSSTGGYTTHSQGNPALLENVEVSSAGILIVFMSASIDTTSSDDGAVTGRMGVDIDGPTATAPENSRAVRISNATATGMGGTYAHVYSVSEGTYTIESRYAVSILATTGTVSFNESTLIAIAL